MMMMMIMMKMIMMMIMMMMMMMNQAIYDVIALVITVTWTAVGTHFIADLFLRKNYNTKKPNQDTCDFDLYWFSFAVILLGWVAVCLAVAYIINKHGRELLNCVTCNKYGY